MNVVEIEEAVSELSQAPYGSNLIWDFMLAYGAPKSAVARIQTGQGIVSDLADGVVWRKWLHFCPSARGLIAETLETLEQSAVSARAKVRYLLTTDGVEFGARDLKTGEGLFCELHSLGDHFGFFLPIAGIDRYEIADENPVDIKATGRLAKLYDALVAENPSWKQLHSMASQCGPCLPTARRSH